MSSRLLNHLPIKTLTSVGVALEAKLQRLGIHTVYDLLLHFPLRYENRAITANIADIYPGQTISIEGQIIQRQLITTKRRMLICTLSDGTGMTALRFMHFNAGIYQCMTPGNRIRAYGEIKRGKRSLEIIHPHYKILNNIQSPTTDDEALTPIYPITEGLSQTTLRKLIQQALLLLQRQPIEEILPTSLYPSLPDLYTALSIIHFPPTNTIPSLLEKGQHPAQQRLIIEELLAYQLSMQFIRNDEKKLQAYTLNSTGQYITAFLSQLPFTPTTAQRRVTEEIKYDMQQSHPMMRLVQGDVGSGKTLVAAMAALFALENGKQVALMAPTEILAEQHYYNFKAWFEPLNIHIDWVSSRLQGKTKQAKFEAIAKGEISMVIGTHAIFYEHVQFNDLGLVIIDEQHRFGVNQRLNLWEKGINQTVYPHQLMMTATPIPRTLAMTAYAHLDLSLIDELPPGRTPITTVVIPNTRRLEIIERVKQVCLIGGQVYWVCTLVEESETFDAQDAENLALELQQYLSPIKVGLIHGRMKANEKQQIMSNFKQNHIQLLVATTVIEVGVDVPNASLMIIENAERLGLSQLHQLRGRVGRGSAVSHCVLLYQAPLSKTAQARLKVMRESNDGFIIAQKDMEIRGIGEILGTKQIGTADFKIVDLVRDQYIITQVQQLARYLMAHHPHHARILVDCWLPNREKYINV
ncbi:MAG: ATP-dependent DNA helicase RecG [Candidatus Schmidhempelia sp.]|nr:ATP-dependent DNA helicase RecG [Candidatus Schmidhempelia sp.]